MPGCSCPASRNPPPPPPQVLAYLQSEGYKLAPVPSDPDQGGSDLDSVFAYLDDLHRAGLHGQQADPAPPSASTADLGRLLWGFCNMFGHTFDYEGQAVSPSRGGIWHKPLQWRQVRVGLARLVESRSVRSCGRGGGVRGPSGRLGTLPLVDAGSGWIRARQPGSSGPTEPCNRITADEPAVPCTPLLPSCRSTGPGCCRWRTHRSVART